MKAQIEILKGQIALKNQELAIKDQLIALEEKRTQIYKEAGEKKDELLDRALKLSEKKSPWETWGALGLIAIIVITIASVF